ncbi:hypothetical protein ACTFIY_001515 [Dictyostelium cf. discoideum]
MYHKYEKYDPILISNTNAILDRNDIDDQTKFKQIYWEIGNILPIDHAFYVRYNTLFGEIFQSSKNIHSEDEIFKFDFEKAIGNCDLEFLKVIYSLNKKITDGLSLDFKFSSSVTKSEILNLSEYINSQPFNVFNLVSCSNFYPRLLKNVEPSQVKLNIDKSQSKEFHHFFRQSFLTIDFKMMELYVLNFEKLCHFVLNPNLVNSFISKQNDFLVPLNKIKTIEVLQLFNILFGKYSNLKNNFNGDNNNNLNYGNTRESNSKSQRKKTKIMFIEEHFKKLSNYLYCILIKTNNITPDQLKNIRKLFENHSIAIEQQIYHSVRYLQIRSQKLAYYYKRMKMVEDIENIDFNLFKYKFILGQNSEYYFKNSLDEIIIKLFQQISMKSIENIPTEYAKVELFNINIEFCLLIDRVDLMWIILDTMVNYSFNTEREDFSLISYFHNSPFHLIKSTSSYYGYGNTLPPIPEVPQSKLDKLYTINPACTNGNI